VERALYRELSEETGLTADQVTCVAITKQWYRYQLPKHMLRHNQSGFVGQKQKYCLLKLHDDDHAFVLDGHRQPEFDDWAWVSYWYPIGQVWLPKRDAYRGALKELAPALKRCMTGAEKRA